MNSPQPKLRFSIRLLAIAVGCVVTCDVGESFAQDKSFQSGSAYRNGQMNRTTPGVSQYDPKQEEQPTRQRFSPDSNARAILPTNSTPATSRQAATSDPGPWADVGSCNVEFIDVVDVPALEIGDLLEVSVREGDEVPMGKPIARINPKLQELELRRAEKNMALALERAEDRITIKAQEKQYDLARNEYETTRKLAAKGAKSASELRRVKFEFERSKLQIDAAKQQKKEATIEFEAASSEIDVIRERLARHTISVGFDGIVIERFKHTGEWVQAGEPIAKVARMDEMFVQGLIRYEAYNAHELKGKPVVVTVTLAKGETMDFEGVIESIPPNDAGSGEEYMVKARVKNRMIEGQWVLRKDARVTMKIKVR